MTEDNPPFVSLSKIPDSTHIAVEYRVVKRGEDSYSVERFLRCENHTTALRNANAWAAVYRCEVRDTTQPLPTTTTPNPAAVILEQVEAKPLEYWWEHDDTQLAPLIDRLVRELKDEPYSRQVGALGIMVGMLLGELAAHPEECSISIPDHVRILNAFTAKATQWVYERTKKGQS